MSKNSTSELDSKPLSFEEKIDLMCKKNYEHIIDYGFYDPILSGSIDGTDTTPHDRGLVRARNSRYVVKNCDLLTARPQCSLFVGRLGQAIDEKRLKRFFERFGSLESVRIVRDLVTGFSRGYGFVSFKHRHDAVSI